MSLLLLNVTLWGVSNKHCLLSLFSLYLITVFHLNQAFKKYALLAHLSQRLIGELLVYPWSVGRPKCSNILFSETAWPIKAKFYVEPPWVGGTKFCSGHVGHMVKTRKKSSSLEPVAQFPQNLVCSIGDLSPS